MIILIYFFFFFSTAANFRHICKPEQNLMNGNKLATIIYLSNCGANLVSARGQIWNFISVWQGEYYCIKVQENVESFHDIFAKPWYK